jgi:23S rRNA pseudouridine2605 synthase
MAEWPASLDSRPLRCETWDMRLNQYIALHTGISRRSADRLIKESRVTVNGQTPLLGHQVTEHDKVEVSGLKIKNKIKLITILLNKPVGYVCSRNGQGSQTIYDLIPEELHHLKPVGRLDKDSSGLLLMTNDGQLANELTHPSHQKQKVYLVELDKLLSTEDTKKIESGIHLEDGLSQLNLKQLRGGIIEVRIYEGRNRQIRRTFASLRQLFFKTSPTRQVENYRIELRGTTLRSPN